MMARATWSDVVCNQATFHLLTGLLDDTFEGGPGEKFDTERLRFAVNLMKRCCSALALRGVCAVQGARTGGRLAVQMAIENDADLARLRTLTSSQKRPSSMAWKGEEEFVLDQSLHERLLEVAGPPDERGAGRRARERAKADMEERSLRWKVSGDWRSG
jgi:hypothetical protein